MENLFSLCRSGDLDTICGRLDAGVYDKEDKSLVIHRMIFNGPKEIIHELVKRGWPIDIKDEWDRTPLFNLLIDCYITRKREEVFDILVSYGASLTVISNVTERSSLFYIHDDIYIARRLIKGGCSVFLKDKACPVTGSDTARQYLKKCAYTVTCTFLLKVEVAFMIYFGQKQSTSNLRLLNEDVIRCLIDCLF